MLHPISLADALLWVAHVEVYQPLWSRDILAELRSSVLKRLPEANIDGRVAAMVEAFPEAEVTGYQRLVGSLANDPKDRHVLATAIVGKAQVIVTTNLRHFAPEHCEPYGIEAQHPDEFLTNALHIDPERVLSALARQASANRNPPMPFEQLLERLRHQVPLFIGELKDILHTLEQREPERLHRLLDE